MARIKQTENSVEADPGSLIPKFARSRPGAESPLLDMDELAEFEVVPAVRWPVTRQAPSSPCVDEVTRQWMERSIGAYLSGGRLQLIVTDNRYTMISVKRDRGLYRLRMHHMFLDGGPEIVRALGRYVAENDRDASLTLGSYIDANQGRIRRGRRSRSATVKLETLGQSHDLQDLFNELNGRYFDHTIDARITWGRRPLPGAKKRRRNSIKMGSYSVEDRLIRIHPSLDRPFVPRYFVSWIVYHEMLHQKHDIPVVDGRRQFHTPAFLAEERLFEEFERAQQWERVHLNRLLVY